MHISTHSHSHLMGHFNDHKDKLDISHTIHHLSFGNDEHVFELKDMLHREGKSPLFLIDFASNVDVTEYLE